MVLIYQPPNAHVRILWILLRNAMAAAAVKKIYIQRNDCPEFYVTVYALVHVFHRKYVILGMCHTCCQTIVLCVKQNMFI
jgi:hypothetical protein